MSVVPFAEGSMPPAGYAAGDGRRMIGRQIVRTAALIVAVSLGAYAVVVQWGDIHGALARVGVVAPVLAFGDALAGLAASARSWRALLIEFGELLPWRIATRLFFVGQLRKYQPGCVWPVLAQ